MIRFRPITGIRLRCILRFRFSLRSCNRSIITRLHTGTDTGIDAKRRIGSHRVRFRKCIVCLPARIRSKPRIQFRKPKFSVLYVFDRCCEQNQGVLFRICIGDDSVQKFFDCLADKFLRLFSRDIGGTGNRIGYILSDAGKRPDTPLVCPLRPGEITPDRLSKTLPVVVNIDVVFRILRIGHSKINTRPIHRSVEDQRYIAFFIGEHFIDIDQFFQTVLSFVIDPLRDVKIANVVGSMELPSIFDRSLERYIVVFQMTQILVIDLNAFSCQKSAGILFRRRII